MKKIAVIGIGGVGGFVGGRLAARFADSETTEIVLVARGENEKAIRENGLKIISIRGEEIVRPKLSAIENISDADLIILATKEYDLENTVSSFKKFIGEKTSVLPLLNGVDISERIKKVLPDREVWEGCIYIVSRLSAPGVVSETGNICLIHFGDKNGLTDKQKQTEKIFHEAGIDAKATADIEAKIWEKFVFISSFAATTSYLNANIGEILADENHQKLFDDLVAEIKQIARAKEINISENAIQEKFDKLSSLPFEATSSMHTDFEKGNRAEIDSLVGYVVREAEKLNVKVPVYEKIYDELLQKISVGGQANE